MPRIRFSIATLMLITLAVSVVICLASRLDNNIREFRRSIHSGDPDVVDRLLADSGHRTRSPEAQILIVDFEPSLLEFLFFKRNFIVKFMTMEHELPTYSTFDNQFHFTIGPFRTELNGHSKKWMTTFCVICG